MNKEQDSNVDLDRSVTNAENIRSNRNAYPADIVFLSTTLNVGGVEKSILNLARGLPRIEFRPHVIGLKPPGRLGRELDDLGISWESMDMESPPHPEVLFRIADRLEERSPDIVHSFQFYANMIGRTAGSLSGVPVVVSTVRNCDPSRIHLLCDGYTHGLVDREICVAPAVREYVHKEAGVPSEKLETIPSGVDPDPPEDHNEETNELMEQIEGGKQGPLIMAAGRLTKKKGFDTLIKSLPKIVSVHQDLTCLIFGEGPEEDELRRLITERNLSDHVVLAGWTDQLRDWLSRVDLFVLPSRREGLPNVLLEAISMEVPFVATRIGGVPDLLSGSEQSGGLLVEPESPRMLSSALETVLDRRAEFEKGVRRFSSVVREEYSISKMVTQYYSLYKELLSS